MTRCSIRLHDGDCRRPLGHDGACRPTYFDVPLCGAWMRYAKERCARRRGHTTPCRTQYALDNKARRLAELRGDS